MILEACTVGVRAVVRRGTSSNSLQVSGSAGEEGVWMKPQKSWWESGKDCSFQY